MGLLSLGLIVVLVDILFATVRWACADHDWTRLFPHIIVRHLVSSVYDHKPLLVDTCDAFPGPLKLFQFENS